MDQNFKDAKANIGEAKDDLKEMISSQFDAAKKNIIEHLDGASDATKEAIVDMANQVKKLADAVVGKMNKPEEPIVKE
jgi:CHASE3 domain sensor protein